MQAYCGYNYTWVDRLIAKQARFAIYKRPFCDSICLILQNSENSCVVNSISELDHKSGFVLMPFDPTDEDPLIVINSDVILNNEKAIFEYIRNLNWANEAVNYDSTVSKVDENISFENYGKDYEVFHKALEKDEFKKLVLSRSIKYETSDQFSIGITFNKAIEKYPDAFVYLANTPESGTWFGCTPELLLSDDSIVCRTVALAGTMTAESDLNWSDKDRTEQNIVTTYMQQQLHSLGLDYCQHETQNAKAGNLVHLKTEFTFRKKNVNISRLLNTLHPTPAVCGFPKQQAFNFIQKNETDKRHYYSGFVGPINIKKQTSLYVNLRCMKIEQNILTLYAGGGILKSSELNKEWGETENKLKTILSIINE